MHVEEDGVLDGVLVAERVVVPVRTADTVMVSVQLAVADTECVVVRD